MTPEYWNKPVPTTTRVHAVAFSMTVKRGTMLEIINSEAMEAPYDIYERVTLTEIRGNGVLVERTKKGGW